MTAKQYDFEVEQGTSLSRPIVRKDGNGTPINLTGYAARMQVRQSISSDSVLLELSTQNGKIQIDGVNGMLTLIFMPSMTSGVKWSRGKYDLELTAPDGTVTRLLFGEITLSKEVTRD